MNFGSTLIFFFTRDGFVNLKSQRRINQKITILFMRFSKGQDLANENCLQVYNI